MTDRQAGREEWRRKWRRSVASWEGQYKVFGGIESQGDPFVISCILLTPNAVADRPFNEQWMNLLLVTKTVAMMT